MMPLTNCKNRKPDDSAYSQVDIARWGLPRVDTNPPVQDFSPVVRNWLDCATLPATSRTTARLWPGHRHQPRCIPCWSSQPSPAATRHRKPTLQANRVFNARRCATPHPPLPPCGRGARGEGPSRVHMHIALRNGCFAALNMTGQRPCAISTTSRWSPTA